MLLNRCRALPIFSTCFGGCLAKIGVADYTLDGVVLHEFFILQPPMHTMRLTITRFTLSLLAFGLLFVGVAARSQAAFVLQVGQSGVAGISTIAATPGSQIELEYYLTQTGGMTNLNTEGLGSFMFSISTDEFSAGLTHAEPGDFEFTPGFLDFAMVDLIDNSLEVGSIGDIANDGLSAIPVFIPAPQNSILLGRSRFNVAANASGDYNVSLDPAPFLAFTLGPDIFNSVPVASGGAVVRVTAVPEPTTGLAIGGAVALLWLRRRRKNARLANDR